MTPETLAQLRAAETASSSAAEALANLERLKTDVLSEMLALANTRLRGGLPDELFRRLDFECLGLGTAEGLRRCMDDIVLDAEDHASDCANNLDDITVEIEEAGHAVDLQPIALAAE